MHTSPRETSPAPGRWAKHGAGWPILAVCLWLAGCTAPQLYTLALQWQRQACQKIDDRAERQRCDRDLTLPYAEYRAQAEALHKR